MIAKVLSPVLLAVSMLHVFPVDGAVLEWQAGAEVPSDTVVSAMLTGPRATLPMAKDRAVPPPKKIDLQSFGVVTTAQSVAVTDAASGATLYVKNANEVRPNGSISKLMSALVFL